MIHHKNKLVQILCKHERTEWHKKHKLYVSFIGETQQEICKDCGKIVGERYIGYEMGGF